jgi:hypothetical protein
VVGHALGLKGTNDPNGCRKELGARHTRHPLVWPDRRVCRPPRIYPHPPTPGTNRNEASPDVPIASSTKRRGDEMSGVGPE